MKTILSTLSILILTFVLQSCNYKMVTGNGSVQSHEVSISDYKTIDFSGGASLVYEQKPDTVPYLRIEIDDNLYPLLTVKSDNGVLDISQKGNIRPTKYTIYTNSSSLVELSASGSIKAHIKGKLETSDLKFTVSGSGNIVGDSIVANSITSHVSGSGDITMTGKTGRMESSISGSGKTIATDMVADTVECTVSGSGSFFVHAEKRLKVEVSGSGDVQYKGNPQIEQSISGSGKVVSMN